MAEYARPVFYWRENQPLLVDPAPSTALLAVSLLGEMSDDFLLNGDTIRAGVDTHGQPVHYLITGWDAGRRALVVTRIPA